MRVGSQQVAGNAGIYIAQDKGYFAEQGLSVEDSNFTTTSDILVAMAGGQIEVGGVPISAGFFKPFGIDYNFRKSPTLEFVAYLRAAYGDKQPFAFHGDNHHTDSALIAARPAHTPRKSCGVRSRRARSP